MQLLKYAIPASNLIEQVLGTLKTVDNTFDRNSPLEDIIEELEIFNKGVLKPQTMFTTPIRKHLEMQEAYGCIALSTAALTDLDIGRLAALSGNGMVFERDTGYFIKLYDEVEAITDMLGEMDEDYNLDKILVIALNAGYRMVEFDCDASIYSEGYGE